ncbi:unnamed protein product [Spirodela intermedia]|uniref:Cyclin N-terminal domain-containing protein n=1 Tax=Spirodela intermedia TaxID=51605 RepID=A0A7I8JGZ0_SPIIN|nr:unnamed protein product [Spirodela intermedia]CAA6669396.1 unnamed protein product [Spirodela intermedia]
MVVRYLTAFLILSSEDQARLHLDLALGTAFSAVNLLDRFVSMYTNLKWEGWMMELLSLACLSIAAKFDEVVVSSLHSFPVEDFDHSFHPNAIQRMELTVLRPWTGASTASPLTPTWFSPCVVAVSATRCALEELALPEPAGFISDLISLIPHEHIEMMEPCHRCMEERVADPLHGLAMEAQSPTLRPVRDGRPVAKNEPKRSHRRKRKKTERMQD